MELSRGSVSGAVEVMGSFCTRWSVSREIRAKQWLDTAVCGAATVWFGSVSYSFVTAWLDTMVWCVVKAEYSTVVFSVVMARFRVVW